MSPFTAQGLTIAAQAIAHAAGPDDDGPVPLGVYNQLPFSSPANLALWAPWVRASLYLTDFTRRLDWTPGKRKIGGGTASFDGIELLHGGKPFLTLHRPSAELCRLQLSHLRSYADQRSDRAAEILTQVGFPSDYFASILGLNGDANRHCFELIAITQVLASHIAMIAKHHLACLRPDRRGATVMPMLPTPAHGSFPSAHAAEAFAAATVLSGLVETLAAKPAAQRPYPLPDRLKALLLKQAERIAVNRTVAGMHYPIDTWAGAALGEAVGQLILGKCRGGQAVGRRYEALHNDFRLSEFLTGAPAATGLERAATGFNVPKGRLFAWLWDETIDEFKL